MLSLHSGPVLRVYTGYGNGMSFNLHGHSLSLSPKPRNRHKQGVVRNTLALLRLFIVKPIQGAEIVLLFQNNEYNAMSAKDGFFKFEFKLNNKLGPGCHEAVVKLRKKDGKIIFETAAGFVVPRTNSYSCISDIDDTFLISHSGNLRKRLYVLFTENAHSRRPFEGAVKLYRMLSGLGADDPATHTFFYVSSSEWNLYHYIREFIFRQQLPEGIMLLNQIKTFSGLLKTGQGNHQGKFFRITRILEHFPEQKFILLGDDTQKDPDIYNSITKHFPNNFLCVYIRRVGTPEREHVLLVKNEIEARGIPFLYFAHSADAIDHSTELGIIKKREEISLTLNNIPKSKK